MKPEGAMGKRLAKKGLQELEGCLWAVAVPEGLQESRRNSLTGLAGLSRLILPWADPTPLRSNRPYIIIPSPHIFLKNSQAIETLFPSAHLQIEDSGDEPIICWVLEIPLSRPECFEATSCPA